MARPLRTASYFEGLLNALYGGLEARDVTGYAWDASDRWARSRTPGEWRSHLECWLDLGGTLRLDPPSYQHECRLVFAARYHADSDVQAQSRLQAAIRDACEYLLAVQLPDSARVLTITSATVEGTYEGGWVEVTVSFLMQVPR